MRPNELPGYLGLARARLAMDQADRAVEPLTTALDLYADNAETHFLLGRAYRRLGRDAEAAAELSYGANTDRTYLRDPWRGAVADTRLTRWLRLNTANSMVGQGQTEDALSALQKLHEDYPDHLDVLNDLASAYMRGGRPAEARRLLNRSLRIKSDYAPTHRNLAMLCATERDLPSAVRHIETAAQLAPDHAGILLLKGKLLLQSRRYRDAAGSLQLASALLPQNAEAHGQLGVALFHLRRSSDAIAAFEKAVSLDPHTVNNRLRLGLLYAQEGRKSDAVRVLREATAIDPDNAMVANALADIETGATSIKRP